MTPASQAIAALLIAGGAAGAAQAQSRAFSPGWFADKGAAQSAVQRSGRLPDGSVAGIGNAAQQQAQSRQQLQRSLDNLNRTAAAVAAQQAAQAAARAAAAANGAGVPDGLTPGGLWAAEGALAKWEGAKTPQKSAADGRQVVTIEQTQSRAILNWDTFNVGRDTTLQFKQNASDAVLNRVVGASAKPSEIHGAIKADGTVLVVNQNGVIFTGTSQVNARNLVAAAATITDSQFRDKGIYTDANGTQPTFKDALGKIELRPGASIATHEPGSATRGGGYVLLLGSEVHNAGQISTPRGQTVLAAGDDFYIRKGYGTDGNVKSTTAGNEVGTTIKTGSAAGLVRNSGLISAATGDITLTGRQVRQDGVLVASTDIGARGAIHLLNRASDASGSVVLGEGSVTAVVLESSALTGLDGQRDAALKALDGQETNKTGGAYDHLSTVADRRDLSRIEVVTGGQALFAGGSTTVATGGQIAVSAGRQALLQSGAALDVAGAIGVQVAMESNSVRIDVQGNEQRDSPVNRDSKNLNNSEVWVDRRTLVKVAAGVNGYQSERWYTAGGLLEVGGYLATSGRGAGEWLAQGGTATFTGGELVTRAGSDINLSGGTLDVRDGYIRQSWLRGADGRLYELSRAPGDLLYTGLYKGFEQKHERWGERATRTFYNPLIAPRQRYETGYTVGRDAGQLLVSTERAALQGALTGEVYQGPRQTDAPQRDQEGFYQSQTATARRGQLVVGQYLPRFDTATNRLAWGLSGISRQVTVGQGDAADGEIVLDAAWLNQAGLGALRLAGTERVVVQQALRLAPGGEAVLYAPWVAIDADLSAPGGRIQAGNVLKQMGAYTGRIEEGVANPAAGKPVGVRVGARVDAGGLWTNLALTPQDSALMAWRHGGSVALRSSGDVSLTQSGSIDVSSGAARPWAGSLRGGKGGDVTLAANALGNATGGVLTVAGEIAGYGVDGGGKLLLQAERVSVGRGRQAVAPGVSVLGEDFFASGFSQYEVAGVRGLEVVEGARVRVTMPVLRYTAQVLNASDRNAALETWTPPLYQDDPLKRVLTQRLGADLTLRTGAIYSPEDDRATAQLTLARGASIEVDPRQAIALRSAGQITLDGVLRAPGGTLRIDQPPVALSENRGDGSGHKRSLWVGDGAVLDVAGRAAVALDAQGRRYGWVDAGGAIVIGGEINTAKGSATSVDAFVVLRPGSLLEASGAFAILDLPQGGSVGVASAGGSISLSSYDGLYLDGTLRARAGGAGAAGGVLSVALETPVYANTSVDLVRVQRELLIRQQAAASLPDVADPQAARPLLRYGHGELALDRYQDSGFGTLNVLANGFISASGAVDLRASQAVRLFAGAFTVAEGAPPDTRFGVSAPYVLLAQTDRPNADFLVLPAVHGGLSKQDPTGAFAVHGNTVDVRDRVSFGANGYFLLQGRVLRTVDGRGYGNVSLAADGDLRFLRGAVSDGMTILATPGSVALAGARIYPETQARAVVEAGYYGKRQPLALSRVGADESAPYSAFGELTLTASRIDHGAALWAPLGNLSLNAEQLSMRPGSLTSVSARGLVMPYGGTVDGVAYAYGGKPVVPNRPGDYGKIALSGNLDAAPGSRIDLSGGGELLGAAFVSGRGGSSDARYTPLMRIDPSGGGFSLPGLATNPVYAVVPGAQATVAPTAAEAGEGAPLIGRQIQIGAGVPGLSAGTYTLMPASYALLPGAFRVEIDGRVAPASVVPGQPALAMRNGSWSLPASFSVAGTAIRDALPSQVIVTPAQTLRRYSQYNETSYARYVLEDAQRRGMPRAMLERDAKLLSIDVGVDGRLDFQGRADFRPAEGGRGGELALRGSAIEVLADGAAATPGMSSYYASTLNGFGASRISVGGLARSSPTGGANVLTFASQARSVTLRDGALLRAPQVFVSAGGITLEAGAAIDTIGAGRAYYDSAEGYLYSPGRSAVLALSNGLITMLPPDAPQGPEGNPPGAIEIGACAGLCARPARLYTEGTLAAATDGRFILGDQARYGARQLALSVSAVNAGSAQALAAAAARGALPAGMTLNQGLLDRLLAGDADFGAPALEVLTLTVRDSVNFYETVDLSAAATPSGKSLGRLELNAPAIYGYGAAGDRATLRAQTLIWGGGGAPTAVIAQGAGTGQGTLDLIADRIEFGYGPTGQPDGTAAPQRMALGFATVNLNAAQRITANHRGSLSVYQSQGAYVEGSGPAYQGGNLNLYTPLITGEAGSIHRIKAGGAIVASRPAGAAEAAPAAMVAGGAEWVLDGDSVRIDTAVALPSGKLTLAAQRGLVLGDGARLDLAGRKTDFHDVSKYGWGGELRLESRRGDILQAPGSLIDLSASHNRAGSLTAIALDPLAGRVDLLGAIQGQASGRYDAGGTLVPYGAGGVDIRAQRLDFAALNQRLNAGGVFGSRSFQIKQGDLTVGDEVRARQVSISLDGGRLTVAGRIDASGEGVGSIRLAAAQGLRIAAGAALDAHGSVPRLDSYGQPIDAPNRALIELNSGAGRLQLDAGASFDLRAGAEAPGGALGLGSMELNAPRLGGLIAGDIDIDASGALSIRGARSVAVNGMAIYRDARTETDPANGAKWQVIDQDYLDHIHDDSRKFVDAALANAGLRRGKLAGLLPYADALHLRPGVEVRSASADGDLVVQGDLDLSRYRYASLNPRAPLTSIYGSGEVGSLAIRAGGNLEINGSINDGFAPPPVTPDDSGWLLLSGVQTYRGDLVVPDIGVSLAQGTTFPSGAMLNFELPLSQTQFAAGTVLPVAGTLAQPLTLPAGTVLAAAVHDAHGALLYPAGALLAQAVTLPADARLGAGSVLAATATLAPLRWPAGVALPRALTGDGKPSPLVLAAKLDLPRGAHLPSGTDVKLPDGASVVELRAAKVGTQGRNWALAAMLPAGSQSWGLRLVGGADLGAADTRAVGVDPRAGHVVLADTHYAARVVDNIKILITEEGEQMGIGPRGTEVPEGFLGVCEWLPEACETVAVKREVKVWSQAAQDSQPDRIAGTDVPKGALAVCDLNPAFCDIRLEVTKTASVLGQNYSVLRTGTGDLDVAAAGDVRLVSPYGVYTAGTESADMGPAYRQARGVVPGQGTVLGSEGGDYERFVDGGGASLARVWYPERGGNLSVTAGGNLNGVSIAPAWSSQNREALSSASIANWLWRQGGGDTPSGPAAVPVAWGINFGTYVRPPFDNGSSAVNAYVPHLVGFTGFGTLGGGNVAISVGGDAGTLQSQADTAESARRSQGLTVAVGGSGRMTADGRLVLTGGGDIDFRVGGGYNADLEARGYNDIDKKSRAMNRHALDGVLANLRGNVQLSAASLGGITLSYGATSLSRDPLDSRAPDPLSSSMASATGGLVLAPGDATVNLNTRGDLVLGAVVDPGRVVPLATRPYLDTTGLLARGGGISWFTLWTGRSAIDLHSAGGNLTPGSAATEIDGSGIATGLDISPTDGRYIYPPILRAVAAGGSMYYGQSARAGMSHRYDASLYGIVLMPSDRGQLELLASGSIYAGGYSITPSGASESALATPQRPAFAGVARNGIRSSNQSVDGIVATTRRLPLFSFGVDSVAAQSASREPVRIYAGQDLVGVRSGAVYSYTATTRDSQVWYVGAAPVRMLAGRDIVNSGTAPGQDMSLPGDLSRNSGGGYAGTASGNLFVHASLSDVSLVQAGRDILHSSFMVAGPGVMEISAGRNLLMEDKASVVSLGPVAPGDTRAGAAVALQAGAGARGADYAGFLARYLGDKTADPARPLLDQGLPFKTYEAELLLWLTQRYGYAGDAAEARAYFAALPAEQQRAFARQVYFAELRNSGREYNGKLAAREGSYLRGRQAIAALFPDHDAQGAPLRYDGGITLYGGAGVQTRAGGDIQALTPGGAQVFGVEGLAPPSSAGVVTQGSGDIQLYARDSILLGQSRIMTTFGGGILAWSAEGDINAGRGAKTTVVYTPPRRVYDTVGNVALSPNAPSSGAGIATLAPIAEVPAGDVDLYAPLGTIDAGEAGIRVSGNINIAALHVVNAANIQVKGESSGIPAAATVNTGALASASAASSAAAGAAQESVQRAQQQSRQNLPSVISVQILGYGDEPAAAAPSAQPRAAAPAGSRYDSASAVQILGAGALEPGEMRGLTEQERAKLSM